MAVQESLMLLEMSASFLLSLQTPPPSHLLEAVAINLFTVAHQLSTSSSGEGILSVLTLINKLSSHDVKLLPDTALLDVSCLLLDTISLHEQVVLLQLCKFLGILCWS